MCTELTTKLNTLKEDNGSNRTLKDQNLALKEKLRKAKIVSSLFIRNSLAKMNLTLFLEGLQERHGLYDGRNEAHQRAS